MGSIAMISLESKGGDCYQLININMARDYISVLTHFAFAAIRICTHSPFPSGITDEEVKTQIKLEEI